MKNQFIFSFLLIFYSSLFAQVNSEYQSLVKEAEQYYNAEAFQLSAQTYKSAFDIFDGKAFPNDRYNAACSYALSDQTDTSFYHLFRLADGSKYSNYNHIIIDVDLVNLHTDTRWDSLLNIVKANKDDVEKNFDKPLVAILDTIYQDDQKYRQQIEEIEKKYGRNSEEMKAHWQVIQNIDSINLTKVMEILEKRGWLGADVIGNSGNNTLFLVIQHADLATQEKYLPLMRDAVEKKNASPNDLALLEDRVALRKGKKQIYGSQIARDAESGEYYVQPIENPESVDERRKSVGLSPLNDYTAIWNFEWNLESHQKIWAKMEKQKIKANKKVKKNRKK